MKKFLKIPFILSIFAISNSQAFGALDPNRPKSNFVADHTIWKLSFINQMTGGKVKKIFGEDITVRKYEIADLFGSSREYQYVRVVTFELDSENSRDELLHLLHQRLIPVLRPYTDYTWAHLNSGRQRKVFLKRYEEAEFHAKRKEPPFLVFIPIKFYKAALRIIHTEFELLFPMPFFFSKKPKLPFTDEPPCNFIPESKNRTFPSYPWPG